MARAIRYHPLFEADLVGAANWYDARNPQLGSEFICEVCQTVDALLRSPDQGSRCEFGVRYRPLKRFPFVVLYDLHGEEILMLGVMHTARDAQKWLAERH